MAFPRRLFFTPADATPETVFTNTAGQTTTLETVTIANPTGGGATTIRLTIGVDGAATRVLQFPVPAGVGTFVYYPGIKIVSTEVLQLSSTDTDDVAVVTGNGYSEVSA